MTTTATSAGSSEKRALRREVLARRRDMGAEKRAAASAVICEKIRALPQFARARSVLAFAPMEEEVDIWPLLAECWGPSSFPRKRESILSRGKSKDRMDSRFRGNDGESQAAGGNTEGDSSSYPPPISDGGGWGGETLGGGTLKKRVALPRIRSFARGEMSLHWTNNIGELQPGPRGILQPSADAPQALAGELDFLLIPAVAADKLNRRLGYGGGFYDRLLCARPAEACAVIFACQRVGEIPETPADQRADITVTEQTP